MPARSEAGLAPQAEVVPVHVDWSEAMPTPALRDLPRAVGIRPKREIWRGRLPKKTAGAVELSPLVPSLPEAAPTPLPLAQLPPASTNFDGMGKDFRGPAGLFTIDGAPPDPNGDIGPLHYVQAVNESIAVFDKKTRAVLSGPTSIQTLFPAALADGHCLNDGEGDPVILYDRLADNGTGRWFLSQFAFPLDSSLNPIAPFYQCVAVSQTKDPTGSWYTYAFGPMSFNGTPALNDYAKFGAWPDAYYATYNMFNASPACFGSTPPAGCFLGANVCGMDRASMLSGQPAAQVCLGIPGVGAILPAHLTGATPPPEGSPELLLGVDWGSTWWQLDLWRVKVDFAFPYASTLSAQPEVIPVTSFADDCPNIYGYDCVQQPPNTGDPEHPSALLDALGGQLMYRLTYRNFGGVESLVANHTVDADGNSGTDQTAVRFYELRTGAAPMGFSTPVLYQQGTIGDTIDFRWDGSVAQDQSGNIAFGYSISSTSRPPSIAASGRLARYPAGADVTEGILWNGQGSQTSYVSSLTGQLKPLTRWGDYTAMSVDPSDDCTFWYTNQYQPEFGTFDWKTRVVAFTLPQCGSTGSFTVTIVDPTTTPVPDCSVITVGLTARDGSGNLNTAFNGQDGQGQVATDDPRGIAPGPVTFASGTATAAQVTLKTPGVRTISVRDLANLANGGQTTVAVTAQPATHLGVSGVPANWIAGATLPVRVEARDDCDTPDPSWSGSGSATLDIDDPQGTVSGPTYSNGAATFLVTLKTAGAHTLTANATIDSNPFQVTAPTTVVAGAVAKFNVSLPGSARKGAGVTFQASAEDAFGNAATSYAGTVDVTSSDAAAIHAPSLLFFSGQVTGLIVFETLGSQTLTITDAFGSNATGSATVNVTKKSGCGCGSGGAGAELALLGLAVLVWRRGTTSPLRSPRRPASTRGS